MDGDELIKQYIDPTSLHRGVSEARLAGYGIPVWALVGHMNAVDGDPCRVAEEYDVPLEAVQAALAYYNRYRAYIDARLLLNAQPIA